LRTYRQIDDARASAAQALSEALFPETGQRLFPLVIDVAATHGIDPAREGYPDLIALPEENYWVRTKLAPGTAWVEPDANLPGTHRPEGILAVAAPGVRAGRTLQADLRDIAPTVLSLLGEPVPGHMEGSALSLDGHAPRPTLREDAPTPGLAGPHKPQTQFEYTPEEQAIIEQRLADLGYLE
jgi:hypothetical protein